MKIEVTPRSNGTLYTRIDWPELQAMLIAAVVEKASDNAEIARIDATDLRVETVREKDGSPSFDANRWHVIVRGDVEARASKVEE